MASNTSLNVIILFPLEVQSTNIGPASLGLLHLHAPPWASLNLDIIVQEAFMGMAHHFSRLTDNLVFLFFFDATIFFLTIAE